MKNEAQFLSRVSSEKSWDFDNLTRKETNYASHGYHKYPAKFIPQLVERLIGLYSKKGDTILDPFGGCGTTLVESKLNGRNSIVIDVNQAALLITRAKKIAINPAILEDNNQIISNKFNSIRIKKDYYKSAHPRLKYWFKKKQYNTLMEIYLIIKDIQDYKIKTFYECCFSNILKNCSIWYSKSIKPMRDYEKPDYSPINEFRKHLAFMTNQNEQYYTLLKNRNIINVTSQVLERDARNTGLESGSIDLIITSPPYAISYEYADLHQLTLLWFGFTNDMNHEKSKFVGSTSNIIKSSDIKSHAALKIISSLFPKDKRLSANIKNYYNDLDLSFNEMFRVLRKKGTACIIIGDTEYKGVRVSNTLVSIELLKRIGFKVKKVIKRKLSSKTFTPYRDKNGKFTNSSFGKRRKIYQYEYIIIAIKQ